MNNLLSKAEKALALLGLALALCARSASALVITNVSVVNVTPSSFSVVWAGSKQITPAISVYSDAAGTINLAGQLGIEWYPLHTGDPTVTNAYFRRQNKTAIQQLTAAQGLVEVRVSGCAPNTAYYFQLQITDTNGQQLVSPASGPLPSVTTAAENDFVLQSEQLIITLPGLNPAGSIVVLSNTNTPSQLAAVAGDGVASNEVFFSVSDLLAASGQTNYLPLGNQSFSARVLDTSPHGNSQSFSLNFTGDFLVGSAQQDTFTTRPTLAFGNAVLQLGQSSNVPISLSGAVAVTNLTFVLSVPTNRLGSLALQAVSAQLASATLQGLGGNNLQIVLNAAAGQTLQAGQLAQLNFSATPGQSSAFVSLTPQSAQGLNVDGSSATFNVQSGRVVVIGPEPLLDTLILAGGSRELVLYGLPGDSYQIQSSTNLGKSNGWANVQRVPMTNQVKIISGLDTSKSQIFYRAYDFFAQAPILDTAGFAGGNEEFTLYGAPGSAYEVQYSTSLASHNWILLARVPMTNSFQFVTGLSAGTQNVFYRALLLNADPPILAPQLAGNSRSLTIYGLRGTNYGLQYATNLSNPVVWNPLLSYRLTNAFQTVTNLGPNPNPSIFYRLKKQ